MTRDEIVFAEAYLAVGGLVLSDLLKLHRQVRIRGPWVFSDSKDTCKIARLLSKRVVARKLVKNLYATYVEHSNQEKQRNHQATGC